MRRSAAPLSWIRASATEREHELQKTYSDPDFAPILRDDQVAAPCACFQARGDIPLCARKARDNAASLP